MIQLTFSEVNSVRFFLYVFQRLLNSLSLLLLILAITWANEAFYLAKSL